jgi:hypothetical protein
MCLNSLYALLTLQGIAGPTVKQRWTFSVETTAKLNVSTKSLAIERAVALAALALQETDEEFLQRFKEMVNSADSLRTLQVWIHKPRM